VIGPDRADGMIFRRIARRVEDILEAARQREDKGQTLALDIDARLRMEDVAAVQFQLASAILEETNGLRQEEVVGELLSLGLASVLRGAAKAIDADEGTGRADESGTKVRRENPLAGALAAPAIMSGRRTLN
jgi:hypothetical protein